MNLDFFYRYIRPHINDASIINNKIIVIILTVFFFINTSYV